MEGGEGPTSSLSLLLGTLYDLEGNQATLTQIAEWCSASYTTPGGDKPAVYSQAQNYMKDALLTVMRQLKEAASVLLQALELQGGIARKRRRHGAACSI